MKGSLFCDIVISASVLLTACQDHVKTSQAAVYPQPVVYVAGLSGSTADSATIWENSTQTVISPKATAQSIYVSGNNVYAAGWIWSGDSVKAAYWKNGAVVHLPGESASTYTLSIFVSGNDVHVAGYDFGSSAITAKYWKNGVIQPLTAAGNTNSVARSIFVSGSDVYVAGWVWEAGNTIATYWKNGVATLLTDGSSPSIAESIFVSGNDVYVAGTTNTIIGHAFPVGAIQAVSPGNNNAVYWKNGDMVSLAVNAATHSIFVSGTDVYVAGEIQSEATVITPGGPTQGQSAAYWKNGNRVSLSDTQSSARSISVARDGDVYTAGISVDGATLWRNTSPTILDSQPTSSSYAYSIFLVDFGAD